MSNGGKKHEKKKKNTHTHTHKTVLVCCFPKGERKDPPWLLKLPKAPSQNSAWWVDSRAKRHPFNGSVQFSSVQSLIHVWLSVTPWITQHARPPCPSPTPGVHSNSCALSQWYHPAISSSLVPILLLPLIPPSIRVFSSDSSHEVAKVLEFQPQHQSFQRNPRADLLEDGLVGSLCSPRDSPESSPTPQFKSINSLALSFLHSPTLTSIHDHRKNHSLD